MKQQDRQLDAPGEANRHKHINFLAEENGDVDPADEQFDEEDDDTDADAKTFEVNEDDDLDEDEPDKENDSDLDDEALPEDDNGFFTDDDNELETEEEKENESSSSAKDEKVVPLEPDTKTTLGDKITMNANNEDLLTGVTDDNDSSYANER